MRQSIDLSQVPDEAGLKAASHSECYHRRGIIVLKYSRTLGLMPLQVLFATGDVMAQQAVERVGVEKHNFARTGRMALYGGGILFPSIPFPPNHAAKLRVLNSSRLWSCRNNVVQIPPAKNQSPQRKRYHRRPRSD